MAFLGVTIVAVVILSVLFGVGRLFEDEEMEYYKKSHKGRYL